MQFHQARSHHRQVSHHRRIFEERVQRFHHFHGGSVRAVVHKLAVGVRRVRPIPSVGEGMELRLTRLAGRFAKEDVVIRIGIERRVEVFQINAGVRKNFRVAQPFEIIAEQEAVHLHLDLTGGGADSEKISPSLQTVGRIWLAL